jgi:hypothetical protein
MNSLWKVEDVISYFGEYLDKSSASDIMDRVNGNSYFELMNKVRDKLIEEGYSVPFRSVYRRVKI